MRNFRAFGPCVGLLLAACSSPSSTSPDLAETPDLSASPDLGAQSDFAQPVDSGGNADLIVPADLTVPADLSTPPTFAEQAYLKPPNLVHNSYYGDATAIAGDTVVVGAYQESSNQTTITNGTGASSNMSAAASGAAYVYLRSSGSWAQQAYIKPANSAENNNFGTAVAISADTLVVGAPFESSSQTTITNGATAASDVTLFGAGAAYVFVRSSGNWTEQAYLKAANTAAASYGYQYGSAVAIDGDTIVVGSPVDASNQTTITNGTTASSDTSASRAGAVFVYVRSGSSWTQQAYLKAPNARTQYQFGNAVAISGDTIVVGSNGESSNQTTITNGSTASSDNSLSSSGAVYVFVRSGSTWSQQAYVKPPNAHANYYFGGVVAISGDTFVVSDSIDGSNQSTITNGTTASSDTSAPNAGAAYVFVRSGSNWSQQAYLKASNNHAGNTFGSSVSIAGDNIAVGAYGESSNQTSVTNGSTASSDTSVSSSGAAYLFSRASSTWSQTAYFKAANPDVNDGLGCAVGISGTTVVVGAYGEDANQTTITNGTGASSDNTFSNGGAAYVFSAQ